MNKISNNVKFIGKLCKEQPSFDKYKIRIKYGENLFFTIYLDIIESESSLYEKININNLVGKLVVVTGKFFNSHNVECFNIEEYLDYEHDKIFNDKTKEDMIEIDIEYFEDLLDCLYQKKATKELYEKGCNLLDKNLENI